MSFRKDYNDVMLYYMKKVTENTLPENDKDNRFQAFYEAEELGILNVEKNPNIIIKKLEKLQEVRKT